MGEKIFSLTAKEAWSKAAAFATRAEESFDDEMRILYERLRDRWISIANKFEFEEDAGSVADE